MPNKVLQQPVKFMPNKVLLLHYRAPTNLYSHIWRCMGIVFSFGEGVGGEAVRGGEAARGGEATWRGGEAALSHKVTIFRP